MSISDKNGRLCKFLAIFGQNGKFQKFLKFFGNFLENSKNFRYGESFGQNPSGFWPILSGWEIFGLLLAQRVHRMANFGGLKISDFQNFRDFSRFLENREFSYKGIHVNFLFKFTLNFYFFIFRARNFFRFYDLRIVDFISYFIIIYNNEKGKHG